MATFNSIAAAVNANVENKLIKRSDYIDFLEQSYNALNSILFGSPHGTPSAPAQNFDTEFWMESSMFLSASNSDTKKILVLKEGKTPAEAVTKIVDPARIGLWRFDCQRFANIVHLYAMRLAIPDDSKFNAKFATRLCTIMSASSSFNDGQVLTTSMTLAEYGSTIWSDSPTGGFDSLKLIRENKQPYDRDTQVFNSGGIYDTNFPLGSLVVFQNLAAAPELQPNGTYIQFAFEFENSIKWKDNKFIAAGYGSGGTPGIFTKEELFVKLADSWLDYKNIVLNPTDKQTFIQENVFIKRLVDVNALYVEKS